jgi:transcriptional regulator with XRE-family HTH domain
MKRKKTARDSRKSNNHLRRNVRRLMKQRGVQQRELEVLSKGRLTQAAISYLLSGKNIAKLSTLDELARLLGANPWELIMP